METIKLKLRDNENFLLDVNRTIKRIQKLFPELQEQEIIIELHSIQAWLEKVNKNKRWKERGVEAGILNWFKKYSNSPKFSRRGANGDKARGEYRSGKENAPEREFESDKDILTAEAIAKAKELAKEVKRLYKEHELFEAVIKKNKDIIPPMPSYKDENYLQKHKERLAIIDGVLMDEGISIDAKLHYIGGRYEDILGDLGGWSDEVDRLEKQIEELVGVEKALKIIQEVWDEVLEETTQKDTQKITRK